MKRGRTNLKSGFVWLQWTSMALVALMSAEVLGAQAAPNTMLVDIGSSKGGLSALAQSNEGRIVNLYTNRKGNLSVIFKYSAAGLGSNLKISGSLRPHSRSDTFTIQSLNASGTWNNLGTTTGLTSYSNISLALPTSAAFNGSISIRLISSRGADDLDLDQLILADSGTATPPPATNPPPTTTPPAPSTTTTLPSSPSSPAALPAGTNWYWQLSGNLNLNVPAKVYDIDVYDTSAATIASLKAAGHKVICYFSAGTYEDWRSDASQFPPSSLGNKVSGWAGEKWLDVRNSTVRTIMAQRMDLAKSKGCDGLEPDNVDGYANKSGFPLTKADQINYNTFLADQAHARGMIVALKNSTDLVSSLVHKFDFAVVEECFRYNECEMYAPFISQNKAVLNAEYTSYSSATCSEAARLRFSTVFYNLDLNGSKYQPCQ